ncbi:MAG: 3-deoxy-D-manno-octulosonic acid transferase [Bacteroidales bacterium]|jgi:3-deoxy-D-manno-octulosonic-acid transferase|nr:3-deoxy-D-manno-octulosonic acid transferase [Bacteroidales bacterium]
MSILYNLSIRLYAWAVWCLSISNKKAKLWVGGRKNLFLHLEKSIRNEDRIIWFHCASLGEFEQGRPLMEHIRKQQPHYKILLTFFSPSGYEIRKDYQGVDYVFYLPVDTVANAKKFLETVQPEYIFFVKYEFWFNYIHQAYLRDIPFYSVSSIFSERQIYFNRYGKWFRKRLGEITHFFAHNQSSVDLLHKYAVSQAGVFGDTRFDRVYELSVNRKELPLFSHLRQLDKVVIAGSTWQKDEQVLLRAMEKYPFTLVLAPHETDAQHIEYIESLFSEFSVMRYSQMSESEPTDGVQVFIIDTIGILNALYPYGKIAYIGGGFGVGIHNILEAATYGMPVVFGTNYRRFKEADDLIARSGAFSIADAEELSTILSDLLNDKAQLARAGSIAKQYVTENIGVCSRIYSFVFGDEKKG